MKNLKKIAIAFGVSLALVDPIASAGLKASAADYYVVVNEANGFNGSEDEARALIRRLYLKTTKNWPGGETAVPFARKGSSDEQMALLQAILDMSDSEHVQHWARLKQTTGDTPPRAVGSNSILLRLIKREPGAIGVIDASAPAPQGVKVLLRFSS